MKDKKHILIADDEENILNSLAMVLEDNGYEVSTALSGSEAMDQVLESLKGDNAVDLVVSDVQMAGLTGIELLEKLNEMDLDIPLMVITGYGDKEMLIELMRKGCIDYIDKPLEPTTFLERVRTVFVNADKRKGRDTDTQRMSGLLENYRVNLENLRSEVIRAADAYKDLVFVDPKTCRVTLAVENRTMADCGGDFFDFRNTKSGCDFLLADVAGHDLSASYHTVLLKAFFDENCRQELEGKRFLKILNEQLIATGAGERMITALFVRVNVDLMFAEVVSAGSPSPIRVRTRMPVPTPLPVRGDPLGVFDNPKFESRTFPFTPGDRLFAYTDGILRARHSKPGTREKVFIQEDKITDLIGSRHEAPVETVVKEVWDCVLEFCEGKPEDDMLLVGIEIPEV